MRYRFQNRRPVHNAIVRKMVVNRIIFWVLFIASVWVLLGLSPILSEPEYFPSNDFLQFWTGWKLVTQGENPIDPYKIGELKKEVGSLITEEQAISIILFLKLHWNSSSSKEKLSSLNHVCG